MNLPIPWVAVAAIPVATQAIGQSLNSASHFFGDILRSTADSTPPILSSQKQASANGLSVQPAQASKLNPKDSSQAWADRFTSIKKQLSKIVEDTRVRLGQPKGTSVDESLTVSIEESGLVRVEGADPVRAHVQQSILSDGNLVTGLSELAASRPSIASNNQATGPDRFRIWID